MTTVRDARHIDWRFAFRDGILVTGSGGDYVDEAFGDWGIRLNCTIVAS